MDNYISNIIKSLYFQFFLLISTIISFIASLVTISYVIKTFDFKKIYRLFFWFSCALIYVCGLFIIYIIVGPFNNNIKEEDPDAFWLLLIVGVLIILFTEYFRHKFKEAYENIKEGYFYDLNDKLTILIPGGIFLILIIVGCLLLF